VNRRHIPVSGLLLACLLTPAAYLAAQPDCSNPKPPTGSIRATGPQVRVGDRLIVSPAVHFEVTATDAAGGPAQWTPMAEGQEVSAWPASWSPGEHTVGAVAVDGCGHRAPIAPVAFVVDAEPPAIRWETGAPKTFIDTNRLAPDSERDRRRIRFARKDGRPADDSWISLAGVWQVPLSWVKNADQTFLARDQYPVLIASNHPQAFLAAPGTVASLEGADASLSERLLWIAAEDPLAGVERLSLSLSPNGKDRASTEVLKVEVTDSVGNTSRKEIVLRPGSQPSR
jgi:hypothetical protein